MFRHICALIALAALSMSTAACTAEAEDAEVAETTDEIVSRSATFETFQGSDGQFYFHMLAANGENLLRSEGYVARASAAGGVAALLDAGRTTEGFAFAQAKSGEHYFNVKAENGEIVATSELYATKASAERGARTIRTLVKRTVSASADAAEPRERFETFTGEDRKAYFRLRAGNGEIVLASQGYASAQGAQRGIRSVTANGAAAASYQVFEAWDGGYGLRLVAQNGEIIARGEIYASKSNATRAAARIAEMLSARELPVETPAAR